MLKLLASILLFFNLNPVVHAQTPPPVSTDWPQLQHDVQHTGRSAVEVDPHFSAAWVWMDPTHIVHNFISQPGNSVTDSFADKATYKQNVLFAQQVQPVVASNIVYFGALNGTLYAVDANDMKFIFKTWFAPYNSLDASLVIAKFGT